MTARSEAEDFQAVGVRLRETMVTFAGEVAHADLVPESTEDRRVRTRPLGHQLPGAPSAAINRLSSSDQGGGIQLVEHLVICRSRAVASFDVLRYPIRKEAVSVGGDRCFDAAHAPDLLDDRRLAGLQPLAVEVGKLYVRQRLRGGRQQPKRRVTDEVRIQKVCTGAGREDVGVSQVVSGSLVLDLALVSFEMSVRFAIVFTSTLFRCSRLGCAPISAMRRCLHSVHHRTDDPRSRAFRRSEGPVVPFAHSSSATRFPRPLAMAC